MGGEAVCTTNTCTGSTSTTTSTTATTTTTAASSSSCVVSSGPASGQTCVFPFTFNGVTHSSCAAGSTAGSQQAPPGALHRSIVPGSTSMVRASTASVPPPARGSSLSPSTFSPRPTAQSGSVEAADLSRGFDKCHLKY